MNGDRLNRLVEAVAKSRDELRSLREATEQDMRMIKEKIATLEQQRQDLNKYLKEQIRFRGEEVHSYYPDGHPASAPQQP